MRLASPIAVFLTAFALICPAWAAETITLKAGQTLVGDVQIQGEDALLVHVHYPQAGEITVKFDELTPISLYEVLERRTDPKDPAGRKRLAEYAGRAGLYGAAIAEYRALKDLDAGEARFADKQIRLMTEAMATNVLEDAKGLLETESPRAALLYLHTVIERYPKTKAAREAMKIMPAAHKKAGAMTAVAERTVPAAQAPKLLESIGRSLGKGDAERLKVGGHEGRLLASSAQRRALDRAVLWYEHAWKDSRRLPVAPEDQALKSRIQSVRERAKELLVSTYLDAASFHLQRRSIPKAEEYCNRACEIDPDSKKLHEIHWLILQAKTYGYS
ncbi:MAG: hypothetical protein ACE5H3_04470 [Planctomycetota bacterium]